MPDELTPEEVKWLKKPANRRWVNAAIYAHHQHYDKLITGPGGTIIEWHLREATSKQKLNEVAP